MLTSRDDTLLAACSVNNYPPWLSLVAFWRSWEHRGGLSVIVLQGAMRALYAPRSTLVLHAPVIDFFSSLTIVNSIFIPDTRCSLYEAGYGSLARRDLVVPRFSEY